MASRNFAWLGGGLQRIAAASIIAALAAGAIALSVHAALQFVQRGIGRDGTVWAGLFYWCAALAGAGLVRALLGRHHIFVALLGWTALIAGAVLSLLIFIMVAVAVALPLPNWLLNGGSDLGFVDSGGLATTSTVAVLLLMVGGYFRESFWAIGGRVQR